MIQRYARFDATFIEKQLDYHRIKGGCYPAVYSFSNIHIGADWFPMLICESSHRNKVIPLVRLNYPSDHIGLAKGKFDSDLKYFARSIVGLQKPLFFVPWPGINFHRSPKGKFSRSGKVDAEAVKGAWLRIYNIFEEAGANEFAVWGLHLILPTGKSIDKFKIDPELFDWIGFTVYKINNWVQVSSISYEVSKASKWAKTNYPNKPVALFELGACGGKWQKQNIINAYKTIKKLPRIKMVMYSQVPHAGFGSCHTLLDSEGSTGYKKMISGPYFIKGGTT